jgi:DNA-binding CsgD family transcriptional regulator
VVNSLKAGQTVPEDLPSEIGADLRSLATKLEALICEHGHRDKGASHSDNVLLDVEVGDVRLIALRRGHPTAMSLLSPREQEIARMVAKGYANKTIASVLEISSWTVASHLRRIFVKLQVSSRAAMTTCLLGVGFNDLPALLDNILNDGDSLHSQPSENAGDLHRFSSDDIPSAAPYESGDRRYDMAIEAASTRVDVVDEHTRRAAAFGPRA